jgi:hypothetical protein
LHLSPDELEEAIQAGDIWSGMQRRDVDRIKPLPAPSGDEVNDDRDADDASATAASAEATTSQPPTLPSAADLVPRALLDRALQALDYLAMSASCPTDREFAAEAARDVRRELGEPSPPKSPSPSTPSPQPKGEHDAPAQQAAT